MSGLATYTMLVITEYRWYSTSSDTVYCSICSPQIYVSQRRHFCVIGFININKYTSATENVHLCLKKTRQLGHMSVATGRILSLFCVVMKLAHPTQKVTQLSNQAPTVDNQSQHMYFLSVSIFEIVPSLLFCFTSASHLPFQHQQ